jgi:tetratricopeptide (TPR) repeat protein
MMRARNRTTCSGEIAATLFLMGALAAMIGADWPDEARTGQDLYRDGRHEEAAEAYRDAIAAGDPRPELSFNLGNALFRAASVDTSRLAEALETYQRAVAAGDATLRPAALYNAANTLFEMGQLVEAEKLYREVLRQNPEDDAARYNLELVQRLLQNQPPPEQGQSEQPEDSEQESQEDGSQEQDQPRDQRQDAPPDSSPGEDESSDEEPPPQDEPQDPEEQQESQGESQGPPEVEEPVDPPAVSPEEALRELEKLEEMERELLRQILKAKRRKLDVEKDW